MPLKIEYNDSATSLNLYAILMRSDGYAFKPTTQTFASYTDATITNFNLNLTEDVNRAKYYTYNLTGVTLAESVYMVEIYRRIGVSPDKAADVFKAVGPVYWNGSGILNMVDTPHFGDGYFVGMGDLGDTLSFHFNTYNQFGNLANADTTPTANFMIHNAAMFPQPSHSIVNLSAGLYSIQIPLTTGVFTAGYAYSIDLTAYLGGTAIGTARGFVINNYASINASLSGVTDVAHQLGYASGYILSSSSTSGYITTLPSNINDHYNGSIMRVRTGTLRSEARIVRDYIGSTKYIQTQIGFTSALTSGTEFLIYPIGGQLAVF